MDATIQFLTQHGTIMLFLIVLAEQVGLPIPALPMLIAAGALVGARQAARRGAGQQDALFPGASLASDRDLRGTGQRCVAGLYQTA